MLGACGGAALGRPALIAIDSTRTHQTMIGWEATVVIDEDHLTSASRDSLIRSATDQFGITRLRLPAQGQVIESVDHTHFPPEFALGSNDNDDPSVTVPERFWWKIFDRGVRDYVLPIKATVEKRGVPFVLNICFVGFKPTSRFLQENPAEYVEFMLAVLGHLKQAYPTPLEPDLWEMRLEPDNGAVRMTGLQMGAFLVAAGDAARKAGYKRVRFSVPSTLDPNLVPGYVRDILRNPGAAEYIAEISYHRYRKPQPGTLEAIGDLAAQHGWSTAMLEHIRGDHRELAEDLTKANVSAWQQHALVGSHVGDDGGKLFVSDRVSGSWRPGKRTVVLRQYFKYVPPGSVRLDASSTHPAIIPAAFRRPDGGFVTVLSAPAAVRAEISGLPAGTYTVSFAGDSGEVRPPVPVQVSSGAPLPVELPTRGALTVAAGQP